MYAIDSFKSKREKFYEKLRQVSSEPKKTVYSTLAPVLTTENKEKNSFFGENKVVVAENTKSPGKQEEKNILDIGYRPVNEKIAGDLSKTQRFEISSTFATKNNTVSENKPKEALFSSSDQGKGLFSNDKPSSSVFSNDKIIKTSQILDFSETKSGIENKSLFGTNQDKAASGSLFSSSQSKLFSQSTENGGNAENSKPQINAGPFSSKQNNDSLFASKPANESLFASKPANESLFISKPANESLFISKPTNESLFTSKPANESLFTSKPANELLIGSKPSKESLFAPKPANDAQIPSKPASGSLFTSKPTTESQITPKPPTESSFLSKPVSEPPVTPKPTNEFSFSSIPTNESLFSSKQSLFTSKPTSESLFVSKPVIDLSKPINDSSKPMNDSSKPTNDSSKQIIDLTQPNDSSKPTGSLFSSTSMQNKTSEPKTLVQNPANLNPSAPLKPALFTLPTPIPSDSKPSLFSNSSPISFPTTEVKKPSELVSKPLNDPSLFLSTNQTTQANDKVNPLSLLEPSTQESLKSKNPFTNSLFTSNSSFGTSSFLTSSPTLANPQIKFPTDSSQATKPLFGFSNDIKTGESSLSTGLNSENSGKSGFSAFSGSSSFFSSSNPTSQPLFQPKTN